MELLEFFQILWRRKWVIILTAAVTMAVAYIGISQIPWTYTVKAKLRISTARTGSVSYVEYDIWYTERLMNTYARIAISGPILEQVQEQLGLGALPAIQASVIAETELLEVSYEHTDPEFAKEVIDTYTEILLVELGELYTEGIVTPGPPSTLASDEPLQVTPVPTPEGGGVEGISVHTVSVVEPARLPRSPSGPNKKLFLLLGGLVSLTAGAGLAVLFDNLDTKLYSTRAIETVSGLPVLGEIPAKPRSRKTNHFGESFRRLRTSLFSAAQDAPLRVLLITSPKPGEGKSSIAVNLALSIAQAGRTVAIVDADMRHPSVHTIFGISNEVGLSNILEGEIPPEEAMRQDYPNLHTITSGARSDNPVELLGSAQMSALIQTLVEQHDVVLLDTPAFLAVADAAVLTSFADGVLLVVKRGTSRQETLLETCYQLANLNARSAGIIVNYAERKIGRRSYRGYVTSPSSRVMAASPAEQTPPRVQVGRNAHVLRSVQTRSAWPPPQVDPILAPEKPLQPDEPSTDLPEKPLLGEMVEDGPVDGQNSA